MSEQVLVGCSDGIMVILQTKEDGPCIYPDKDTKRLRSYSQFFNTAEMDSIFYEKFYSKMTKGTFIGMVKLHQTISNSQ